jgi:cyclopropane-fatty-acyl-phospholipid synthase
MAKGDKSGGPRGRPGPWQRSARALIHRLLRGLRHGSIELVEGWSGERFAFGGGGPAAVIQVLSPRTYTELVRDRSVGLGTSYADGLWEADDLVAVCRILAREVRRGDAARRRLALAARPLERLLPARRVNTRRGARRNIAAHYDLGNELFELFLDSEAMMYSSALFEREDATLEEAQLARLERVCQRLELVGDDHLLEIGTGWGGLAVHAADRYGCRVTTTTISSEQREYAEARVRRAGLEDRVTVLGADYRDLAGTYDKLVSLEMIEAVGWQYFDTFFRRCSELLEPHGLFFLQAIAVEDGAYEAEKLARSFANELIFPGGCLPSLEVIQHCLARATDMRTVWLEDISPSYVLTLRHWRERFVAASEQLGGLGYDERFRRLWTLWLALSEAGFHEARIRDLQLVAAKPGWHGRVGAASGSREARREAVSGGASTRAD